MRSERGQHPRGWSTTQLVGAAFVVSVTVALIIVERSFLDSQVPKPVGTKNSRGKAVIPEYTGQDSYALQLQPSLASQFVLYLGYHGNCSRAAIQTFHSSKMSLATAMELCEIHPNCTFFSYRREVGVTLCSGRHGTAGSNRINVAAAGGERHDAYWVSGDKVGCEDFGYEEALALHHAGTIPSCFFQAAGCAFSTHSSRRCLSNMLDIRPDRTIRLGGKYLCQNPVFGLSIQAHKTESCSWTIQLQAPVARPQGSKESGSQYGLHYVTDNSGMPKRRLIPDMVKPTPTGKLASAEVCLCHNAGTGLAMGDYCGNEDCYWDPASAKCLYRNRKTGACLTSLIKTKPDQKSSTPLQSACHDIQLNAVYLAAHMSTNPEDARCTWHFAHDQFVNDGTRTSLQAIVQHREDGTLLAAKPQCLCYNAMHGLHISSTCPTEFCQWTRGRLADPSDSFKEAFRYTVTQRTARYTCVLQLEPLQFTSTAQEAFQMCNSMPLCTYVAYNQHDGATYVCQGHHGYLEVGPHQHVWLNAFKKGCEAYDSTETYHDLLTGHPPSCLKEQSCTTCPVGASMVVSCSPFEAAVCDTCRNGYCGQLPSRVDASMASESLVSLSYTPISVSAVKLLGRTYMVTGYTTAQQQQANGKQPLTKVSLCEYDTSKPGAGTSMCHVIDIAVGISNLNTLAPERTFLYGALQAFQFRGRVYLASMAHVGFGVGLADEGHKYPVLLRLSPNLDKVVSGIALQCSYDWMLLSEVSLMMLPTWSKLYMVTSVSPLVIMLIDQDSGSCSIVQRDVEDKPFEEQTAGHRLVGMAPLFPLSPDTYLGVVHRRVKYPFGPIYTQHFVTLKHDVGTWVVTKLSEGFRLPSVKHGVVFDKQVVSGLLLLGPAGPQAPQGSSVLLAFTTGDNMVGVAISTQPVNTAALTLSLKPALPEQEQRPDGMIIRWETPIHESSRLAWNALNLLDRLVNLRIEVQLQVRDTSADQNSRSSLSSGSKLSQHIISTNRVHNMPVDMLVRYMWPPNMQKTTAKRVVHFMPWPFASFPSDWVPALKDDAHQIWVPSKFARNVLVESGIPADKVHDVPYGMSNATCSMVLGHHGQDVDRPTFLNTRKAFLYLFNACIEWAHGVDIVLKSFLTTYSKEDDVALVIHNKCGDIDANQYVVDMLSQARADPYSPEVVIVSSQLDLEQHYQLRAAVDAYVLPMRADLHAQHIFDAVIFGKPTIVPDKGAHMDFLQPDDVVSVRSNSVMCLSGPCKAMKDGTWNVGGMPTTQGVKWHEVDPVDLSLAMQHARTKVISKSTAAAMAHRLCSQVTWVASAKKILFLQDSVAYKDT